MKDRIYTATKRALDILISLLLLPFLAVIFLAVSIGIKLTDREEVLFKQKRVGKGGKEFFMYKFKTMYRNGNQILEEFFKENPSAEKEWKVFRKIKNRDPRVTPVGRILRKLSLDELPQIINVLKGEMSLVGPRPYLKEEFKTYRIDEEKIKKILSVKPGITGLWQVSGRNELTFEERIKLDVEYVEKRSLLLDFKILLKTAKAVLSKRGAY